MTVYCWNTSHAQPGDILVAGKPAKGRDASKAELPKYTLRANTETGEVLYYVQGDDGKPIEGDCCFKTATAFYDAPLEIRFLYETQHKMECAEEFRFRLVPFNALIIPQVFDSPDGKWVIDWESINLPKDTKIKDVLVASFCYLLVEHPSFDSIPLGPIPYHDSPVKEAKFIAADVPKPQPRDMFANS